MRTLRLWDAPSAEQCNCFSWNFHDLSFICSNYGPNSSFIANCYELNPFFTEKVAPCRHYEKICRCWLPYKFEGTGSSWSTLAFANSCVRGGGVTLCFSLRFPKDHHSTCNLFHQYTFVGIQLGNHTFQNHFDTLLQDVVIRTNPSCMWRQHSSFVQDTSETLGKRTLCMCKV